MSNFEKWRGLKNMVSDAVDKGAAAIEEVHLATAKRSFDVLEQIPVVAKPAQSVHWVHDTIVSTSYGAVRAVTRAVSQAADLAIDALDPASAPAGDTAGDQEPKP